MSPTTHSDRCSSTSSENYKKKPTCIHEAICDNLFEGVYRVDAERRITYWNDGAMNLTGFSREEAVGRHCYDNFLIHMDDKNCAICLKGCPLAATLADGERRETEVSLRHKAGHRVPVSVRVSPVRDDAGKVVGAVQVFSDITAHKALQNRAKELETLAFQDTLTGLSNRRHIELRVEQALQEVAQCGRKAGLLLLDIDRFKLVNDRFGHLSGDAVLKAVAESLSHAIRPGDSAGRWGGEEFLFIAMDVTMEELEAIGERCRAMIATSSVPLGAERVQVTVTIGAALLKKGEATGDALKRADEFLYIGKCLGGNRVIGRLSVS
jgi:diguanylate cyclase (GGDEF)-like protein/PAS domain S-box-containing protein